MLDLVPQFTDDLIKEIECELSTCFFVTRSGKLYSVGDNAWSQCGFSKQRNNPPYAKKPELVPLPGPVKLIAAQDLGVHVVLEDNRIFAWGWNWDYGSLGFGHGVTLTSTPTELRVPTDYLGKNVVGIKSSAYTTYVWTKDGTVYALGCNDFYQACNPASTEPVVTLTKCAYFASRGIKVIKIAVGIDHVLFLTEEQGETRLYGLGYSVNHGALTPALNGGAQNPTELPEYRGAINVWAQRYSSYVYMNDSMHSMWVFGASSWGELGAYPSWDDYTDPYRLNDFYAWLDSDVPLVKDIRYRTLTTYMQLSNGDVYISGAGPAQLMSADEEYRSYFAKLQFSPHEDSANLVFDIVAPFQEGFLVRQAVFCDSKTRLDSDVCGGHGYCAEYQTCECEPDVVDGLIYRGEWCNLPSCPTGSYNPNGVLLGPVTNVSMCTTCPTSELKKSNEISQCLPNALDEFRKPDVFCVGYNAESSCFLNQQAKWLDIDALTPVDRTLPNGLYGAVVLDVTGKGYFTYYLALSGDMEQKLFFSGNNRNGEGGYGAVTPQFIDGPVEKEIPAALKPWITKMCSSYYTAFFVGGENSSTIYWVGYDMIDNAANALSMTEIDYGDYPKGTPVKSIHCGTYQLFVQDANGTFYGYGWNPDSMLGSAQGDQRKLTKMDLIPEDVEIEQICTTYFTTMVLSKNNSVWAIGGNDYGDSHLGHRNALHTLTRVPQYDNMNVKSITCGEDHVLVHVRDTNDKDEVYCAGWNGLYVCSHPENVEYILDPVRMDISAVEGQITQVEATYTNTFLLVQDDQHPTVRTRIYGVGVDWWASLGAKTGWSFTQERLIQIDDEQVSHKRIKSLQSKLYGLIAVEATVCNGKWRANDTVCSNQGICVKDGYCACRAEFMGSDCEHKVCDAGFYSVQNPVTLSSNCVACPAGTAGNETRQISISSCHTCPEHTYSSPGSSQCVTCPAKHITTGTGKQSIADCVLCPAGEFIGRSNTTGQAACYPCPRGSFSSENGSVSCTQCPVGYVTADARSTSVDDCFICNAGHYVRNSSNFAYSFTNNDSTYSLANQHPLEGLCSECEVDTYSDVIGRTTPCSSCPLGSTTDSRKGQRFITDCRTCQVGEYTELGADGFVCVKCAAGSYSSFSSFECQLCPSGTWSDQIGLTSVADCKQCPKGGYRTTPGGDSLLSCAVCGKGYWSDVEGSDSQLNCVPCAPGFYSDEDAASSIDACIPCPAGTYLPTEAGTGIDSCIGCPAGVFSPVIGANSSAVCAAVCPAGHYCPDAAPEPIPCSPGYNNSRTHQTSPDDCEPTPSGYYSEGFAVTEPTPCPQGTWNALEAQNSSTACIPCSPGTFSNVLASSSSSSCRPCPSGTFAPMEGSFECQTCDALSYCPIGSSARIPSELNSLRQEELSQLSPEDETVAQQYLLASTITKIVLACLTFVAVVLVLFCVSCLGLCIGLRTQRASAILQIFSKFDILFQMKHNVKMGKSPTKKQTRLGGVLSMVALGVIAGLALFSVVDLMLNNIIKQESFRINSVPVNGKSIEPPDIMGKFSAQVSFIGEWSNDVCSAGRVSVTGFSATGTGTTSSCRRSDFFTSNSTTYPIANCLCTFECIECRVTGTNVRYEFSVPKIFSPSAAYTVEVPHYTHLRGKALPFYMSGTIVPDDTSSTVLQGEDPSQVFFSLFASQYIPEISPFILPFMSVLRFLDMVEKQQDATTGFVMQRISSQIGSVAGGNSTFGSSVDGVKVVFNSELSRFFFIVEETPRQHTLAFLAQVFALCSAVTSVFALVLGKSENYYSILRKRLKKTDGTAVKQMLGDTPDDVYGVKMTDVDELDGTGKGDAKDSYDDSSSVESKINSRKQPTPDMPQTPSNTRHSVTMNEWIEPNSNLDVSVNFLSPEAPSKTVPQLSSDEIDMSLSIGSRGSVKSTVSINDPRFIWDKKIDMEKASEDETDDKSEEEEFPM